MADKIDTSIYYSANEILSHNAPMNFIMGMRGNGKSYDAKKRMINNFIKKGEESVLIRRRKTDIDILKKKILKDIIDIFPSHEFSIEDDTIFINGEPAIYLVALSTSIKMKSIPFPNVTLIVFDEYIEPSFKFPNYLKSEMFYLNELLNTICRDRNNWRLLIIGNSISYVNPFFDYYGIKVTDNKQRFHKALYDDDLKRYLLMIEICQSEEFKEHSAKCMLSRITKGTEYGDYSQNNTAFEDTEDFIVDTRNGNYIYICTLRSNDREVGVWYDNNLNIYIDKKVDNNCQYKFSMKDSDLKEGYILAKNNMKNWRLKEIKKLYHNSKMYYVDQSTKKFILQECLRYF